MKKHYTNPELDMILNPEEDILTSSVAWEMSGDGDISLWDPEA